MCHETLAAPPEPPHCFLPDDHPLRRFSPTSACIRYKIPMQTFTEAKKEQTDCGESLSGWI